MTSSGVRRERIDPETLRSDNEPVVSNIKTNHKRVCIFVVALIVYLVVVKAHGAGESNSDTVD